MLKVFRKKQTEMDLTTGNLFRKIPLFSIPLALTTIFQHLYTTIDLATVSKFGGGPLSMSAIGSNGSLVNLIITMFVALSTGSNVVMSNAKGSNNKEKAKKVLHTAILISLISGFVVAMIGFFATGGILELMHTPVDIIDKAKLYLKIYFLGAPFLLLYNFTSQMIRSLGDSKRPLYILIISGIINVIFDFIFVYYLDMDVAGVGAATVISEAVSSMLCLYYLYKSKTTFVNFRFKDLKIDPKIFKDVVKIGLPAGIQGVAFSFPNVLIQSSLYSISGCVIQGIAISQNEIVAGASASNQIENYVSAVSNSFGVGLLSFVGQNIGAKNEKNVKKSYLYANIWACISLTLINIFCFSLWKPLLSIFITDVDGFNTYNAMLAGRQRMLMMIMPYCLDAVMNITSNYLRGMKHSTEPAITTLIFVTGFRILCIEFVFPLEQFHNVLWLYSVYPISWLLVNLCFIPEVKYIQKKVFAKLKDNDKKVLEQA